MSELLWVAVPSGLDASTAVIRVLVVPRLQAGTLDEHGLGDWPGTVRDLTFELRTDTSEGVVLAGEHPVLRSSARSDLWREFFGGDRGFVDEWREHPQSTPGVAPTHRQAQRVTETYRTSATRIAETPDRSAAIVRDGLASWYDPTPTPPAPPLPPLPQPTTPDFHRTVAMLREHPAVLRELGLVFELGIDRAHLDVGDPDEPRHLSIRCTDPILRLLVRAPWTRYDLGGARFLPSAADSATGIRKGMLALEGATLVDPDAPPPAWAICTAEVDGAVGGLRSAARAADAEPSLPQLRSAGLMLLRPGRADDYGARIGAAAANAANNTMDDARLTADDLVLGYRPDIKTGDGPWMSLCERDASYTVNGVPIGSPESWEEGHVKAFSAVRDASDTLHADEVVARWSGWSLAVPPPDLAGNGPGSRRNPDVPLPYDFQWRFTVPRGTLPGLRFGRRYQLRVRVADATGGGRPLSAPEDPAHASDVVHYTRHEPLSPPTLGGDDRTGPGAALDRLVIRSDDGLTPADLHRADTRYPEVEQRRLDPPLVGFDLAEQHGAFDPLTEEQGWALARRALSTGLPDPAVAGVHAWSRAGESEFSARSAWTDVSKLVELRSSDDPDQPVGLAWSGDRLVVRLAQAKEATIELTSTVRDGLGDHFSMVDWLTEAGVSLVDALNGRHPLLSPPRVLHVVHAVRRPLDEPRWKLGIGGIARTENDTTALLSPDFPVGGLDLDSTGQLDIAASWTEWTDAGPREVVVDHVHTERITRDRPRELEFRHAFGDTKHRRVTYTLTATSRFRQYFAADEPDDAFHRVREQDVVVIPSTARPAPPVVLAVTPAFQWASTRDAPDRITRVRRAKRLRVEIAPPWYDTGEGERLGVLVAPENAPVELVAQLGRDPLWGTPAVLRYPSAEWFAGGEPAATAVLPGPDARVHVVPYQVTRQGDRWCADVELPMRGRGASYAPLVRLAVARYQPASLAGLELSTAVVTDFAPLLPDRTVVVSRTASGVEVTVTGISPVPPNRVEVTVEHGSFEDADLVAVAGDDGLRVWRAGASVSGEVGRALPAVALPAGKRRLRVREVEHLHGVADDTVPAELRQRSVFLDIVPIPDEW